MSAERQDLRERMAYPGDADLTLDVSGVHVVAWSEVEGSIMVRLADGSGWWDDDGRQEIDRMTDAEITATINNEVSVRWLVDCLGRWCEERTPLRLTLAPDRLGRLAELDATTSLGGRDWPTDWICLPFNDYPDGAS